MKDEENNLIVVVTLMTAKKFSGKEPTIREVLDFSQEIVKSIDECKPLEL